MHCNVFDTPHQGFDDDKGDYRIVLHDHIYYRYEVLGLLGNGAFGQVMKVLDHKTGKNYALKIIRNRKRYHQQALVEHKILMYLKKKVRTLSDCEELMCGGSTCSI